MLQNDLASYHQQEAIGLGTALHDAGRLGKPNMIKLLLDKGANPST